jgi:hypothetical protein
VFTAENANSGWADITQDITIIGNHIHGSGWATDNTEHQIYFQSFYGLMEGNLLDGYLSTAQGSNIKWRGIEGIFRYNDLGQGPSRMFDLVDNQDGGVYMNFEWYLNYPGQTDCDTSPWCQGDTAGANVIAAYQESAQKDFVYGNMVFAGPSSQNQVHYGMDHDDGMSNRNGTLYFYSNTMNQSEEMFDIGDTYGNNSFLQPRIVAANNILWATSGAGIAFAAQASLIFTGTTNLMSTGTFSIATPILGGNYNAHTANGWADTCDGGTCYWPLTIPYETHIYGLSSANYLSTSTQPYDPTTMIPPSGSAAIEAGSPLSGILSTMPVRWNYNESTKSLTPRLHPLTIGAEDDDN